MSDEPKAVVMARLRNMGERACDVYESLLNDKPGRNASVRFAVAREIINALRDMPDGKPEPEDNNTPRRSVGDLAQLSERIRLLKQEERRGA